MKLKIQLISCPSHVLSAQHPHVTSSCPGQHRHRTFPQRQEAPMDGAALDLIPRNFLGAQHGCTALD